MRLDVVTIFPEYLAPLRLSLPGKAQDAGLLDVHVHDLRAWTHDRHRTVDDTPYGGGAGMVMKPEPWGEALDTLVSDGDGSVLVVPTPSGEPFTQRLAAELAAADRLVFACGRYEGIDQRVLDHARTRMQVREISIGDYVLNGGEVAALVITEAVVRLLPGFMGNPESLLEESHGGSGLLEYPTYTKPASWRGHEVPEVLLSGDHARIRGWRREQALRRTAGRRPDLLHPARAVTVGDLHDAQVSIATTADAGEILTLQRACWAEVAVANGTLDIPVLCEDLDAVLSSLDRWTTFVLRIAGRLVGSVRGRVHGGTWEVERLMVAPDLRGRGLGRWLLERAESAAPPEADRVTLLVGSCSHGSLRLYQRAGYRRDAEQPEPGVTRMSKQARAR